MACFLIVRKCYPFLVLLGAICVGAVSKRQKNLRLQQFDENCDGADVSTYAAHFRSNELKLANNKYNLNFEIEIARDWPKDFKIQIDLVRCRHRDSPNTCEKYQSITIPYFCKLLNMAEKPWTPIFSVMAPKIVCPIKKGSKYRTRNNTSVDTKAFASLPMIGNYHWIATSKSMDQTTNELLHCVRTAGQLIYVN
ncbi:uncharacterized protein LOC132700398 [Cylas formicarius]|uniref:uncharacterized protein LOC132700398 n=1 Tax=Cylas formicarius TaxID=197179 RepID=UPI00295856D3|nr:uncharacterized protein LOC132700398 [Cylas formicarius]